ncbi:MAG: Lin0512 family protein [Clostridia bacterium]|nr:Lin0512 family protein [Clostridia bacterium]
MEKRYIVELGMGVDLHGGDVTCAAIRAIKDATSKSCLCGIADILQKDPQEMRIHVRIGTSRPDDIDVAAVKAAVPVGRADVEIVQGGLEVTGLHVPYFGEGDQIVAAVAALTVVVDV